MCIHPHCIQALDSTRHHVIQAKTVLVALQTVTLDSNFACFKKGCKIGDLEVVQVQPGAFYENIRLPSVNLYFYKENPKKVITGYSPWIR